MTLEQLYQRYGQLAIQAEILQNQLMEVKRQIAEKMNEKLPLDPVGSTGGCKEI